jgi:hypothetical protein
MMTNPSVSAKHHLEIREFPSGPVPGHHSDTRGRGNSMICLIPSVGDLCTNPKFKPTLEVQYCFSDKYAHKGDKASEWAHLELWIYLDHEVILEI